MQPKILIVGAGFSGAVLGRELAEAGLNSLIIDARDHIAGNCFTRRHEATGVMEHVYGPHIFNTNNERVWSYVRQFCDMEPFINRVKANITQGVFSLPINLHTINQFFGLKLNPQEAQAFLANKRDPSIGDPRNFEELALKTVGRELYEAFIFGYTRKQWGCEPRELPADFLKRLPVRFNYENNYYNTRFQGIPREGYSALIARILDHPRIEVRVGTKFEQEMRNDFSAIFYSGAIDAFYGNQFGRLGYRTVYWDRQIEMGDFQGNAVINYPGSEVPFTRVIEHKHFAPWETHEKSLVSTEFSKETTETDIPYYPKRLRDDRVLLERYEEQAQKMIRSFMGRLATYRYLDMPVVIEESLNLAARYLAWTRGNRVNRPVFSHEPV